ncbi:MAG TPA: response regulator [Roseiflexaceae bacterium]|nr:response regulator [Roseiflexaceae bacterium]
MTTATQPYSVITSADTIAPLILVVDDDAAVRKVLGRMLAHLGYTVCTASDTVTALEQVHNQPALSLALIDLILDGQDGLDTARALRTARPALPIVLMSGDPFRAARAATRLGSATYLGKPCLLEQLQAAMELGLGGCTARAVGNS